MQQRVSPAVADAAVCKAAADWLDQFEAALAANDFEAAAGLFVADGHWRDVLAYTWHLHTFTGRNAIVRALAADAQRTAAHGFELNSDRTPPRHVVRSGTQTVESIFRFETTLGRCSGLLRLVADPQRPDQWLAWTLSTTLDEIKGHEERRGSRRPKGDNYARRFGAPNWLDDRVGAQRYQDHEPAVVVVGGGQAGLAIAARLGQLGVDTLVVDRNERVGDNWRNRYHSLVLHNEVHVNHLPYMPFPDTWPTYIPKDKLANWFESYVDAMEINFWTATEFLGGDYDEAAGHWRVKVRREGKERLLRPRHIVIATGVNGIPNLPDLPGLSDFAGEVVHSGAYGDGQQWQDRNAIVLGTGNSGHDVAQDLHGYGAKVTLVQRSPTTIVSVEPSGQLVYALYSEGPPTEDCDLVTASTPYPLLKRTCELLVDVMAEHDRETIDGLHRVGFRMDDGEDRTGFQMKYLRRGGGYYMDIGCCQLVINGEIGLAQFDELTHFEENGARLADGSLLPADLLVLATGYAGQQELMRRLFGDRVADRAGPVWGFGDDGELRNMWKRTAQPGLWFTAGSLAQCRIFSKYLALQLKACEEGLISPSLNAPTEQFAGSVAEGRSGSSGS
jgi:hypothetical protein